MIYYNSMVHMIMHHLDDFFVFAIFSCGDYIPVLAVACGSCVTTSYFVMPL